MQVPGQIKKERQLSQRENPTECYGLNVYVPQIHNVDIIVPNVMVENLLGD